MTDPKPPSWEDQNDLSIRVGHLLEIAKEQLSHDLAWYKQLSESEQAILQEIIRAALEDFLKWSAEFISMTDAAGGEVDDASLIEHKVSTDHIFFIAPLEFTQSINLQQTLQVTRLVVDVLERNIPLLAARGRETQVRHALLYFSREVAFSAASVYASAAEAQGAWDARLETLVIESLISGTADDNLPARLAALGWKLDKPSFSIVGTLRDAGEISSGFVQDKLRNRLRQMDADCCMSLHGDAMVTLVGVKGDIDPKEMISNLSDLFAADLPICVGPLRRGIDGVGYTVRSAVNGYKAAPARPNLGRLFRSDEVLPERALLGDEDARNDLYEHVYKSLQNMTREAMLETVDAYLETRSLEAASQRLGVHGNTVRYRLKRTKEATGWDPTSSRDAYILLSAIKIGYALDADL